MIASRRARAAGRSAVWCSCRVMAVDLVGASAVDQLLRQWQRHGDVVVVEFLDHWMSTPATSSPTILGAPSAVADSRSIVGAPVLAALPPCAACARSARPASSGGAVLTATGCGRGRRAIRHMQRGAKTQHAGDAASDDAARGVGVVQAVVRRVDAAGVVVVPPVHVLPVGANEADAEEGLRRAEPPEKLPAMPDEGSGNRHGDHCVQRRIGFDVVHQRLMVVDAVGGRVAGAEQEVAGAVNGEVAAVLDDAGFETGEDVGESRRTPAARASHRQGAAVISERRLFRKMLRKASLDIMAPPSPSPERDDLSACCVSRASCVRKMKVVWNSPASARISAMIEAPVAGFEIGGRLVGEDQVWGPLTRARAMATRCFWPPLSSFGR